MRKLTIDITPFVRSHGGIKVFSEEITKRLAKNYDIQGIGFIDDKCNQLSFKKLPLPRRIYSAGYKLTHNLLPSVRSKNINLFLNQVAFPKIRGGKKIVVVHDVAYIDTPEAVQERNRHYLESFVPISLEQADVVVAVSEFTKQRLVEEYGLDSKKIKVVPNGINTKAWESEPKFIGKQYGIPDSGYLLFLSTLEPRKNVLNLLDGYNLAVTSHEYKKPLVLAGKRGWYGGELDNKIEQLQSLGLRIYTPGIVDDQDLLSVYKNASGFVLPSIYEGFGIPILEAMACGLPIAASNIPPHLEILEDAHAHLFNPLSVDEIAQSIGSLGKLTATEVKAQAEHNYKIVQRYSWEHSATILSEVINKL